MILGFRPDESGLHPRLYADARSAGFVRQDMIRDESMGYYHSSASSVFTAKLIEELLRQSRSLGAQQIRNEDFYAHPLG
jgi:hypothetical protein